jgi:hypothetical protein
MHFLNFIFLYQSHHSSGAKTHLSWKVVFLVFVTIIYATRHLAILTCISSVLLHLLAVLSFHVYLVSTDVSTENRLTRKDPIMHELWEKMGSDYIYLNSITCSIPLFSVERSFRAALTAFFYTNTKWQVSRRLNSNLRYYRAGATNSSNHISVPCLFKLDRRSNRSSSDRQTDIQTGKRSIIYSWPPPRVNPCWKFQHSGGQNCKKSGLVRWVQRQRFGARSQVLHCKVCNHAFAPFCPCL